MFYFAIFLIVDNILCRLVGLVWFGLVGWLFDWLVYMPKEWAYMPKEWTYMPKEWAYHTIPYIGPGPGPCMVWYGMVGPLFRHVCPLFRHVCPLFRHVGW